MLYKIDRYILINLIKSFTLIFFIFVSIAWLLQLTRLFTLTNFIQIDILSIVYLSFFIIPNLVTTILPFILIFSVLLCFIRLNRDKEIIAIFSLGMQLKPIKYCLFIFTLFLVIFYLALNSILSPIIYEKYKIQEFELRNTLNFNKMVFSNFIKINKDTVIDFKKNQNLYENIFISYFDQKESIIFAKNGFIVNENDKFIFQLNKGFKLNINNSEIEKLEFDNYILKINTNNSIEFKNDDKNTFTIFDDISNKNYLNISYKFFDIIICIFIIYIFYKNNIINLNFGIKNNIIFIFSSIILLIINQLLRNSETDIYTYFISLLVIIFATLIFIKFRRS